MKKIISFILCVALVFASLTFTACGNRSEILKVYNVGEYMDESVISGFSSWYKEQTGKTVSVEYKTYSTNEDMYTEIYKKHADYDIVCGSDYIISRMIKNKLLSPIDRELIYGEEGEEGIITPRILQYVNDYENYNTDPEYSAQTRYSIPYMWGTFGIMYRKDMAKELDWQNLTWDSLFKKGSYSGKRYMKNSVRDAFASAAIVANAQALSEASNGFTNYNDEYYALLSKTINDTSSQNMSKVKSTLKEQKKYLFAYESDDGKDDMITDSPSAYMGLFWSCDAGYAMDDSTDLYYGVPKEGANVWVDGFVIPKYAGNKTCAQWFLKYLCTYDVAYLNRDYAGCSSPIQEVSDDTENVMRTAWEYVKNGTEYDTESEEAEDIEYYVDYFSGTDEDFGDMYIDMLFPSDEVLARCAVMKDSPAKACVEMAKMWISVKAGA
ncbi:MAG: extracellular solute-binding protein [Clostridiales bacterium]|nr:extracellular solute-binding protein [Clostridiales bacterium]